MRLTLRTLLAYLDDMLDPAAAKDIGQRVSENSGAREQVERIREVLRRRRIGAPEIAGPGSGPDPNIVSEYLDNTLSSEGVAELEKLCLESDVHMAEVAASHQILTLVLGEPVEVTSGLRERMYALGHIPDSKPNGNGAGVAAAAASTGNGRVPPPAVAPALRPQVPEYLKRSPWGPRLMLGSVAAVIIAWAIWIMNDPSLHTAGDRSLAVNDNKPAVPVVADAAAPDATEKPAPAVDPIRPMPPNAVDLGTAEPLPPMPAAPPAKVDESSLASKTPAPGESSVKPMPAEMELPAPPMPMKPPAEGGLPAPPMPMPPGPAVPMPPEKVAPAKPALPYASILYASTEGVLLIRGEADWTVLPRRSVIHAGDVIASPEPFEGQLQIDNGRVNVTLFGDTIVEFRPSTDAVPFGLAVHRGRVLMSRTSIDADKPVPFQLQVSNRMLTMTLPEGNTTLGIAVGPPQPQGRLEPGQTLVPLGGVIVSRGTAQVQLGAGPSFAIRADAGELDWVSLFQGDKQGQLRALPAWMSPEGIKITPTQKQFARSFEKEFALDQGVSQSIPAVAKSDIARMSEAAVHTLALTDNYRELVRALQSKHEESRRAAIIALREWLAADPMREVLLNEEAAKVFPDADVPYVAMLLWGFSPAAARDPQISRQLIELMSHEDIAIRELAFFHVESMTGKTYSYKPILPKGQRDAAIGRWDEHLKKVGALLPTEK